MNVAKLMDRLAEQPALDRPAALVRDAVSATLGSRRLRDVLHGVWLGHPLHPALVQLPIGAFVSASLIDLMPGTGAGGRRAAAGLIGTGVLASLPAAVAGAADFAAGHEEQQRTGLVHMAANVTALGCYLASLRRRARGSQFTGVLAALGGLGCVMVGGLLGGHMAYRQAVGANHAEEVPHVSPGEWRDVGPLADFPDRQPVRRMADDVPVMVIRQEQDVAVLADRCSHASGPLHEGMLLRGIDGSGGAASGDGELCVECPWHKSVFRVSDGAVVHGPATAPQPGFDTRIVNHRVQVRVRAIPGVPAR